MLRLTAYLELLQLQVPLGVGRVTSPTARVLILNIRIRNLLQPFIQLQCRDPDSNWVVTGIPAVLHKDVSPHYPRSLILSSLRG